jgi:hypothetical protein
MNTARVKCGYCKFWIEPVNRDGYGVCNRLYTVVPISRPEEMVNSNAFTFLYPLQSTRIFGCEEGKRRMAEWKATVAVTSWMLLMRRWRAYWRPYVESPKPQESL